MQRTRQVGALVTALGLLCACSLAAHAGVPAGSVMRDALEWSEFLEQFVRELREAGDVRLDPTRGAPARRVSLRPNAVSGPGADYELVEGGRGVERKGPDGRRRLYRFDPVRAEADPVRFALAADGGTLNLSGLGLKLQLATPLGRTPAAPGAASQARFSPAGPDATQAAGQGAADGGLSREPDTAVRPGPDDPGLENVAGGQTMPMEAETSVTSAVERFLAGNSPPPAGVSSARSGDGAARQTKPAKKPDRKKPRPKRGHRSR